MKRLARRITVAASALALAITGGVSAEATATGRADGSGIGQPGRRVVIRRGAFRVSGPAGTIVHVRLADPLVVPSKTSTSWRITSNGEWGAVVLHRQSVEAGAASMAAGTIRSRSICASCPAENLIDIGPVDATLSRGDYILALMGPLGNRVTFSLGDGNRTPPLVTGLYGMRYPRESNINLARPPTGAVNETGHGQYVAPTMGRRMLAVVLLGASLPTGGGYSYAICPGAFGRSRQDAFTSGARPTCSGYVTSSDDIGGPLDGLPGSSNTEYRNAIVVAASGTYEGETGGAFAIRCEKTGCAYAAKVSVIALDS